MRLGIADHFGWAPLLCVVLRRVEQRKGSGRDALHLVLGGRARA
jgi:hypothetical protein